MTARQLESDFDPETGRAHRSPVRALGRSSSRATCALRRTGGRRSAADSLLTLTESPAAVGPPREPRSREDRDRTSRAATSKGYGDVRSSSGNDSGNDSGGASPVPVSGETRPVYFVADHLAYDRAEDIAVYTGSGARISGAESGRGGNDPNHQREGDLIAELAACARCSCKNLVEDDTSDDRRPKPTVTRAADALTTGRLSKRSSSTGKTCQMRSEDMTLQGCEHRCRPSSKVGEGVREIYAEGMSRSRPSTAKAGRRRCKILAGRQEHDHNWRGSMARKCR